MADEKLTETKAPAVTAQEAKKVGDAEVQESVHEVKPEVVKEQVAAQVVQPREGDSDKVNVHETFVAMDRVITDPSDPLAVQIPDAGRGDLSLPIHRLDAPTVEDVFREQASSAEEKSEAEAAEERRDEPVNDRS
jgi:hypothetical protein